MISVGNDIIALQTIDISRTNNPKFYSKFLAETELQLYQTLNTNLPLAHFAWLAWSVKESVYKCLKRQQPDAVFSPVKTLITSLQAPLRPQKVLNYPSHVTGLRSYAWYKSTVNCNGQLYYAQSIIYPEQLIYSLALPYNGFDDLHWGIDKIDTADAESQSAAVRALLVQKLHAEFPEGAISIVKHISGCPVIKMDNNNRDISCSFTHHGQYVAYACLLK